MDGLVLAAGGESQRYGSGASKVLVTLAGRPVLSHSLAAFREALPRLAVVVVARSRDLDAVRRLAGDARVVEGGSTRQESVARGFAALPAEVEVVLVHDAARPLATPDLVRRVRDAAARDGAAAAVHPLVDTVHRTEATGPASRRIASTLQRDGLVAAQTPQAAAARLLRAALESLGAKAAETTDEASLLLRCGIPVTAVPGERWNLKVTVPEDVVVAEAILASRDVRSRP